MGEQNRLENVVVRICNLQKMMTHLSYMVVQNNAMIRVMHFALLEWIQTVVMQLTPQSMNDLGVTIFGLTQK